MFDKSKLTQLQYKVTQEAATEPAFQNEYWDNKKNGIYVDIISGKPLFSSLDKFDSGCGWPSFTKPIQQELIFNKDDFSHGKHRIEVLSADTKSHLGHVFKDGPIEEGGNRFCINSASLKFIAEEEMEKLGYGYLLTIFKNNN